MDLLATFSLTLARSLSTKEKGCGSVGLAGTLAVDPVEDAIDGVGDTPLLARMGPPMSASVARSTERERRWRPWKWNGCTLVVPRGSGFWN